MFMSTDIKLTMLTMLIQSPLVESQLKKQKYSDADRWVQVTVSLLIIIIDTCTNLVHKNIVRKANALMLLFLQHQTTNFILLDVIVKNTLGLAN